MCIGIIIIISMIVATIWFCKWAYEDEIYDGGPFGGGPFPWN